MRPFPTLEEMRYNPIMPTNRTLLFLAIAVAIPLWAWAQAQGPDEATDSATPAVSPLLPGGKPIEPPANPAEQVIDEAAKKLRDLEAVAADIRMEADILGQTFQVIGKYRKGAEFRLLLQLDIEGLGDVNGSIQQVCDGETLWEINEILESQNLRRLSLPPILEVLQKPEVDAELREDLLAQIGFTGPHALLEGLRRSFAFDQQEEATLDGQEVWVLRGAWKDREALSLPGAPHAPPDAPADSIAGAAAFLPPYVPGTAELWLGKEDGWPYKLVLQGRTPSVLRDTRAIGPDGRPIGHKAASAKERATEISLLYQQQPNPESTEFLFSPPPGTEVQDDTERAVAALEAQLADTLARRRDAAAAAGQDDGDLLDQSITAPRPDAANPIESPPPPPPAQSPETFRSSVPPR